MDLFLSHLLLGPSHFLLHLLYNNYIFIVIVYSIYLHILICVSLSPSLHILGNI